MNNGAEVFQKNYNKLLNTFHPSTHVVFFFYKKEKLQAVRGTFCTINLYLLDINQ